MPSFWENLKEGSQALRVYASVPQGSGPFPAVVVIHHGPGLDQFTQKFCDRLAGEGYAAAAPDLFHRITDDMTKDGSTKGSHLSDPEIITDVNTTVEWLRTNGAIDGERLGITGFCLGGRVTWMMAAATRHFNAAVPHYGGNIMVPRGKATQSPFDRTREINCPMLFHFGALDKNPSQEDLKKLDAELTKYSKPHQFFTYQGADHGFMNHNGDRYNSAAADTSWPRTLDFFASHLKRAAVTRR